MRRILMLVSLSGLIFSTSCKSEHHEAKEEHGFLVSSPIRKDTAITKEYVSQIHAIQHIELRALERGYLKNIYVDEGQHVEEGQLMFQVMPVMYRAEYQRAEAEANFAKIEYENTKRLADSNVVAPNELAMAKAKYDRAKAELSLAKVHLDFTEIHAPFDGIMNRFHVRLGSLLDEGELLSTLSDNSKMWVYFNVPEAEYLDYISHAKKDSVMNVSLEMANGKNFPHQGKVETIEADFNNETGNISFRATFPNPDGLLRHGETGNVIVRQPLKNALLIPQKATYEVLEKRYVFVVNDENVVTPREITVGAEMPHLYQVKSGLTADEKILLEGLRLVSAGDEISYEFIDPEKAISGLDLYAE